MKTEILYQDQALLIVRKPSGLAVQTAAIGKPDVVSELKNALADRGRKGKDEPYLGIIHRLDQPVEGLLVFAKTKEAAAALTSQLARGELKKRYYAVVCGQPPNDQGELVDYLYKDKNQRAQILSPADSHFKEARRAVLHYRICQKIAFGDFRLSLAEISIETGRFHQIRAQMAHAGMPLLGDVKYGNEESFQAAEKLGIGSAALCAFDISLRHPVTKRPMHFQIRPGAKAFSFFEIETDPKGSL